MCVTHVRTTIYHDGRRGAFEYTDFCPQSDGHTPCSSHRHQVYPDQFIGPSSSMASPSLVHDDLPTPSSDSFPSTPPSATSGPRVELREPSSVGRGSSAKGKAKGPRRIINPQDLRFPFLKTKKERSRRTDEPSPRAHFEDDENEEADGTARSTAPTRRGRGEAPSPSVSRDPAPTGLGSPFTPRRRPTPTEVHQPYPPSPSRVEAPRQSVPSSHRRTMTEPIEINASSSSRAANVDADFYTRSDRARARENHQRQEQERRRKEEAERRQQEQHEARERAEDEHSWREYQRINAREGLREAQRHRLASEGRLKNLQEQLGPEQADRVTREVRERRQRTPDAGRREAEVESRTRDESRHDAEIRRERRLQEAVAEMTRLTDEAELTALQLEIQRLTNEIEREREIRRQREREEEEEREERHRTEILEEEIRILQEILDLDNEQRRRDQRAQQQRSSWNGSSYPNYHEPRAGYRRYFGQAYTSPSTPTSLSARMPFSGGSEAVQTRNPYDDINYRRAHGVRVLQQARAEADARDRAIENQQAVNGDIAYPSEGLHRRNTFGGGGRERETAYRRSRRYYPL